jgi:riboflavin kinase / FMN adenylyltransferase
VKVYNSLSEFGKINNPVVTTGTFDGVHLGHRQIIKRLRQVAENIGGETVLLTFYPHPRMVLFPDDHRLKLLSTQKEKIELLAKAGIDHLIIHPFTKEFSMLSSEEFIKNILVSTIGTKKLVIGYDHHFGHNREGSFSHLKQFGPIYGFDVEEIPEQDIDHVAVSSTRVREALLAGDVTTASHFLGYDYTLSGEVMKGKELGRTIGFPTANIQPDAGYKLIPANGVYAVMVEVQGKMYKGMLNIGFRPTVGGTGQTIEVHILNFNQTIYGSGIKLYFKSKLRDEKKFEGIEFLKQQLEKDKTIVDSMSF